MKEIGGYIEFEYFNKTMLHEQAVKLNCGRNALAYIIEAKHISKIRMPYYMCDSCDAVLKKYNVNVRYYSIGFNFKLPQFDLDENEWLYVVNYYGQLSNETIKDLKSKYARLIIDNAQAYFQPPVNDVDTLYTCRKFFGVSDGAFLYTNKMIKRDLPYDNSYDRMQFLFGRLEKSAADFYDEYVKNNESFVGQEIKLMSKSTSNILKAFDYKLISKKRKRNFSFLHNELVKINKLTLDIPDGPFMYPLYVDNSKQLRKKLIENKIYIPILWPNVPTDDKEFVSDTELAENILPIPCDQRYVLKDLKRIIKIIKEEKK